MLFDLTKEEEIGVKVEEIKMEIKYLRDNLDYVTKAAENDNLNYPLVPIEHLQMHIAQLNQLTQSLNDEKKNDEEKIAHRLRALGHIE